jgi:hypothetical protein
MWFFAPSLESCFLSLYNWLYFHKHAKKNILCVKAKNKILTGKRTANLHKSITKVLITKWQSWQVAKCLMVQRKTSSSSISHFFYNRVFFQESPSVFFEESKEATFVFFVDPSHMITSIHATLMMLINQVNQCSRGH